MKTIIKNKEYLNELDNLKKNFVNEIDEYLDNNKLENETKEILFELKKEIEQFDVDKAIQTQKIYNPFIGVSILFDTLIYQKLIFDYEKSKENTKLLIDKVKDINQNFDIFTKIKEDFNFLESEKIVDFIMQKEKNLAELREYQLNLLENLSTSVVNQENSEFKEESKSNIDFALKTLLFFDENFKLDKENVVIVKDYINNNFNVDLTLKDLKQVQNLNRKIEKENLDINFNNITLNLNSLKNLTRTLKQELELEI